MSHSRQSPAQLREDDESSAALPLAVLQTIDTVARRLICDVLDPVGLGDLWENYPELGEHDFRRVIDRVVAITSEGRPGNEAYETAYAVLSARANHEGGHEA